MENNTYPIAYAAYNNDLDIRMKSTSGGIFTVIASHLIKDFSAVIYGAVFNENFEVVHSRAETMGDLERLRGSKYPQSRVLHAFKSAKIDLDDGRTVLFVGTPCQIEGLKYFLKKEYSNLYCMDFVCHGVASDLIWRDYVEELSKKDAIDNIVFKYKYKGWKKWYFHVLYKNGNIRQRRGYLTRFMHSYLSYANIRPSCYECRFKRLKHNSDFTISDCWGIAEGDVEINDNKGLSALLIQSDKGLDLFNKIKDQLTLKRYSADELMEGNWTATKNVPKPDIREDFFEFASNHTGYEALKKYFTPSLKMWGIYFYQRLRGREK